METSPFLSSSIRSMRSTLLFASFLALVPFVSATPAGSLAARAPALVQSVPSSDGGSYRLAGCITDSEDNRVLANDFTAPNGNTPDSCIGLCDQKGFIRGGVEDGGLSCWCDNVAENPFQNVDFSNCEVPCAVDSTLACGGFNFMLFYVKNGT